MRIWAISPFGNSPRIEAVDVAIFPWAAWLNGRHGAHGGDPLLPARLAARGSLPGGEPGGRKVPPKYRSSSGETWAGRGARPRWLVAAIKGGKKLDDSLIVKSARKEIGRASCRER